MKRSICILLSLVCCVLGANSQTAQPRASAARPSAGGKSAQPKFKAIWEPVNYKEDLALRDVRFISKEEGWATGAAETILHTQDGGTNWTVQLGGDPHAQGEDIKYIFMKDAKHGWAQTWNTLFRTTDGESWQQVTGDIRGNVFFVSETKGFYVSSEKIFASEDGGSTWKQIFSCRAKMDVQGLSQEKDCDLWVLDFPTPDVGYAMGAERLTVKTEDGGATWKVLVGPEEQGDQRVYDAAFLDANTGYEVRSGGKLERTADGGQNWQGVIARLNTTYPKLKFAGNEIGWSILGPTWAYTVDGGKHWTSRAIQFPATVNAFCLPARDRGYLVGEHGMIYRYRIVPIDYASKGMLEASMMPQE